MQIGREPGLPGSSLLSLSLYGEKMGMLEMANAAEVLTRCKSCFWNTPGTVWN